METDVRKPNYDETAKSKLMQEMREHFDTDVIGLKQVHEYVNLKNIDFPYFILRDCKTGRNQYSLKNNASVKPEKNMTNKKKSNDTEHVANSPQMVAQVVPLQRKRAAMATESLVPEKNNTYVPFGFFSDMKNIIASKIYYPLYITGHSGNGKTLMVEQVCAALNRELVRVNITKYTDETDLFGSYELINGDTVRTDGPVTIAMRRGAVLLLDECDYGTENMLCLNGVLEGKPYYDKKTGEVIHPAPGFMVIATANTKGKGDADGRYIGANILNEAFLERFAVTIEQEYPTAKIEQKILSKNFDALGVSDDEFVQNLITWAEIIRKSFVDGAVDDLITTRRLVHIARAYSIFNDRRKALELCLNRFDLDTKTAFFDLYTKVDVKVEQVEQKVDETPAETPYVDEDQIDVAVNSSDPAYKSVASAFSHKYKIPVSLAVDNNTDQVIVAVANKGHYAIDIHQLEVARDPVMMLENIVLNLLGN